MWFRPRSRVRFALRSEALRGVEGPSGDWKEVDAHGDRPLAARLSIGYALLAIVACALSIGLLHRTPIAHPDPWLRLTPFAAVSLSCLLGVLVGFGLAVATRVLVGRWGWARALHQELRPFAVALTPAQIGLVACLSSLGEELFFRGLLSPLVGLLASTAIFGVLHQMRGPSRWIWCAWALVGGLAFAAIFSATGSLLGSVLAHALANATNLHLLRDVDFAPAREQPIADDV
ncbi:MAG: CPBP family intramembrane glutamic endopeptidase [Polyangiaceae bacterium]